MSLAYDDGITERQQDELERLRRELAHWQDNYADDVTKLDAKLAECERELVDPTDPESKAWQFQEVMAAMHGDGGHYLAEHGPKKAADDAIAKWYAVRRELAEARGLLDRWLNEPGRNLETIRATTAFLQPEPQTGSNDEERADAFLAREVPK